MSTTSKGQADEQAITTMLRELGWNVEIARVSKGHFDRIAWKKLPGTISMVNLGFRHKRLLLQLKRNGRPEKGFFTDPDPIYMSLPSERLWVCHWTKGPKRRKWTVWWWEFQGIKSEDFVI